MIVTSPADGLLRPATIEWASTSVEVRVDGKIYAAKRKLAPGDQPDDLAALARLGSELKEDGLTLVGCGSCLHFRQSGAAFQQSGGRRGYCTKVGFRHRDAIVSVDHGCGEHELVKGWPEDLGLAQKRRIEADKQAVDRVAAFEGALLGMAIGGLEGGEKLPGESEPAGLQRSIVTTAVPAGLIFWRDEHRLLDEVRGGSHTPQDDATAVESTAAASLLIALAIRKRTAQEMYDAVMKEVAPRSEDFRCCWERLPGIVDAPAAAVFSASGLGDGRRTEVVVAGALCCFWQSQMDFEATVKAAANTGGDPSAVACLGGAISGAFNGVGAIPQVLRQALENHVELQRWAQELHSRSLSVSSKPQA